MAGYSEAEVYTRIRSAAKTANQNAYVTSVYEPVPKSFPCVFARRISYVQSASATTLTNDDRPFRDMFEVQVTVISNGSAISSSNAIMDSICDEMARIGYFIDMRNPIENIDPSVYRLVARWHRTTGGGDTMPVVVANNNP